MPRTPISKYSKPSDFEAARDAFVQKDYRRALFIFESIDTAMLPEQCQDAMRNIMSTREMQPLQTVGAGDQYPLKKTPIEPNAMPAGPAAEPDLMVKFKAEETVRFQMMRQRGDEACATPTNFTKTISTNKPSPCSTSISSRSTWRVSPIRK